MKGIMPDSDRSKNDGPRVILHVGFPKTGSSFIQSCLALSRDSLMRSGIYYPEHWSDPAAVAGHISSGNMDDRGGMHIRDVILRDLAAMDPSTKTLLYSNESIDNVLSKNPQILRDVLAVVPVHVLAYVRDPAEWFWSSYDQAIKRGRMTGDVEDYFGHWQLPRRTLDFLRVCEDLGVGLTVRNYSRAKANLLDVFADMLSPQSKISLTRAPREAVNRSLSLSEQALQRALNKTDCEKPSVVADALVNRLPDVAVAPRPVTARFAKLLAQNFAADFAEINRYLPVEEATVFESPMTVAADSQHDSGANSAPYSFSSSQLDVMVQAFVNLQTPQLEKVTGERDALQAERDAAQAELTVMKASRSWRYTRLLRRRR